MAAQGCTLSLWLWLWLWAPLLLPLLRGARAAAARWSGPGTTPHLQSIFLGRCAEYTTLLSLQPGNKNCTAIWEAFKVVLDKDPCSVLPSDYDLFINLSRHSIPRDKSLFWENNHLLVMSFSENTRRLMPLCDVLYGNVGDFLSWCRQENASGLDYQSCPTSEDCENNAVDSYWKSASMQGNPSKPGATPILSLCVPLDTPLTLPYKISMQTLRSIFLAIRHGGWMKDSLDTPLTLPYKISMQTLCSIFLAIRHGGWMKDSS
ncbi:ADP-ribosyl cyclase 2 [Cricetulus griseus]|uniref:ADP-ribosyl cyclase/cyclic ADP-ribose hydrolase n=1 Tax=Cricetulus griseus TaxID=10029 RepID=G3IFW5_CRIGR|nr:ADP-ribosyl cyclase 2 [Cricetulus griseus]